MRKETDAEYEEFKKTFQLGSGEQWFPMFAFESGMPKEEFSFCFSQGKVNFLYVLEPRIEIEGVGCVKNNPIAHSIHEMWDRDMIEWSRMLPLEFLKRWDAGYGTKYIPACWPKDHRTTIRERARKANARMFSIQMQGNVIKADFSRKRSA